MKDRTRTLDWRFLAMLAFLLMVAYLVLTGVVAIRDSAEKGHRIDSLIAAGQQADADASRERQALLDAQHRLLERLDAYDARQRDLLAYLRAHGIEIPTRFIQTPRASFTPTPRVTRNGSTTTTGTGTTQPQTATKPGKGKAKGHHKHRGKS